jgi:steroid delta-isomerase-like uncharacterized protein
MPVATPPTGVSNADLIRWSFEQLNRHDSGAMRQLWRDDTLQRFPDRTCHGADEIAAYFEETFAALPDLHVAIVSIVERADEVFVRWRLTGTQQGRIQGIDGTGRRIELDGVDHFTLGDGAIVSNFVVFDQLQWGRQIGLMPPAGSAADRGLKVAFNARTKLASRLQARRSTS